MADNSYWISWWATPEMGQWELHSPWWISGERMDDDAVSVCAAVRAPDVDGAKEAILASYDRRPGDVDWRFVAPQDADWSPFNSRFQKADWMKW